MVDQFIDEHEQFVFAHRLGVGSVVQIGKNIGAMSIEVVGADETGLSVAAYRVDETGSTHLGAGRLLGSYVRVDRIRELEAGLIMPGTQLALEEGCEEFTIRLRNGPLEVFTPDPSVLWAE